MLLYSYIVFLKGVNIMKFSFLIGLIIAIIACFIGLLLNDYNITLKITGYTVVVAFIITGILNGSFINGDAYRANFLSERKSDRDRKAKIINYVLVLSIPNIIIAIVILAIKLYN